MSRLRADLVLLFVALVWGSGFVVQKNANHTMGPLLFVGLRFLVSAFILLPMVWREAKQHKIQMKRTDIVLALFIGCCLFVGASLQQVGLVTTTATNGGFLTALYVLFVPFISWIFTRKVPRLLVVIACVLSVAGAWLLAGMNQTTAWHSGDTLLVVGDLGWSGAIVFIPVFLKRIQRPLFLSFAQYAVTGVLGIVCGLIFEPLTFSGISASLPAIFYAAIVPGSIGFTLQTIAQKHTPPAEASLILSLESVFAASAGAFFLHESLTLVQIAGCALILGGVLLVEIGSGLLTYFKNGRRFSPRSSNN